MSNDGTKSTFNIITVECQTVVQRGGMVNILTVEGTINIITVEGTNNILTVECQTVVRRGSNFQYYNC